MFYGYDFKNQKTDETFGPIVRSRCKPVGCTISMVESSRNHTDQLRKQQVKQNYKQSTRFLNHMQAGNVRDERSVEKEQAVRFEPVKGKRNSPGSELISQLINGVSWFP